MKHLRFFWLACALLALPACSSIPGLRASLPQTGGATQQATTAFETLAATQTESPVSSATLTPMASLDDEQFDLQLAQAMEEQDFETLRALMKDRFSFATWDTELLEVSADEAMQRLQQIYLAQGAAPAVRFDTDVVALLGGTDPLSLWGPVAHPVRAMYVMGLGPNASDEAVLVVGRDETTGQLYWHGMLVPEDGHFQEADPVSLEALQTDVTYVVAKDVLNVRTGPGPEFDVVGLVATGEVGQVTGKSADGKWWRIACTQNTSVECWITADPSLSEPTTTP